MNESKNSPQEMIGEGVGFERIRRITGYLVGTLDRFNNAKRAEVADRVKHGLAAGDEMERLGA
ncbi:MAG: anaerobic ribonucleoside-triphosphate reductase, partial [Oscillospiraceae bacterium]